jgi:hypothetical protein
MRIESCGIRLWRKRTENPCVGGSSALANPPTPQKSSQLLRGFFNLTQLQFLKFLFTQ